VLTKNDGTAEANRAQFQEIENHPY